MLQELVQEIENVARSVVNEIHTAIPGKIVSFDVNKACATVEPIGTFITDDGVELDYPFITGVPIVMPASNGCGIFYPIKSGDSCLLIISEVELDKWRTGAKSEGILKFDLTSAIAIVGLMRTSPAALRQACDSDSVIVKSKDVTMSLQGSTVAVKGNLLVEGNITYQGTLNGENPWE